MLVLAPPGTPGVARAQRPRGRDYGKRRVSRAGREQEPPVGFEPTTARLRIESSTTELRWRGPNLATCCSARYSTAIGTLWRPRLNPFAHETIVCARRGITINESGRHAELRSGE